MSRGGGGSGERFRLVDEHALRVAMVLGGLLRAVADAVHARGGHPAPVELAAPLRTAPPPVQPYTPGHLGPAAVDALVGPQLWHLAEEP